MKAFTLTAGGLALPPPLPVEAVEGVVAGGDTVAVICGVVIPAALPVIVFVGVVIPAALPVIVFVGVDGLITPLPVNTPP